jgi:hypothetical protein
MSLIEQSTLSVLRFERKLTSGLRRLVPHREQIEEHVLGLFPRYKEQETVHSDFYTRFLEYVQNREELGDEIAENKARSQLLNILRSVGQEAKGIGEMFQVATKVELDDAGSLRFTNPLFKKGEDIKAWWDHHISHDANSRKERIRFQLERDQIIDLLFPTLAHPVRIDSEKEQASIVSHLKSEHFETQSVVITKGMVDVCPELSLGDHVEMMLGPAIGTVSPKSIVHNNGETSILWISRLAYIPSVHAWVILQDGRFSQYDDTDLEVFLSMGKDGHPSLGLWNRETVLMQTLALFDTPFAHAHANVIFDELVRLTGKPFGSSAIPGAQKEMTADLSSSIDYLLEVFRYEYERCVENPAFIRGLKERLQKFAGEKHVLHHLATDETLQSKKCFELYTNSFSTLDQATHPKNQRQSFEIGTLSFYKKFSVPVDFSVLDCGTGSIVGAMRQASSLGNLESMLGATNARMLGNIEHRSIRDREEFEHIARSFGKDPNRFTEWGVCTNPDCETGKHGMSNYLGECHWCLACEIKDDFGITGDISKLLREQQKLNLDDVDPLAGQSIGVGDFVSSFAHGGVRNILATIAKHPEYFSV